MKAIAGIFETRENAIKAIECLKTAGYTDNHIVLVNKDQLLNNHVHVKPASTIERFELIVGFTGGLVIGTCTGMGIFEMPGLHEIYNRGILLGAFIGGILGAFISGIIVMISAVVSNYIMASKYEGKLNEGKFLLFLQGDRQAITKAHKLLHTPNLDLELIAEED